MAQGREASLFHTFLGLMEDRRERSREGRQDGKCGKENKEIVVAERFSGPR
jgi:hypothetical protein